MSSPFRDKRILILIGGHLSTAPRPQKEAMTLKAGGAEVIVRGTWWSDSLAEEDKQIAAQIGLDYRPVLDIRTGVRGGVFIRLKHRLAREASQRLRVTGPRALGTGAPEFLREARRLKPDLVIAHSEATLWAVAQLSLLNPQRFPIGVDMEDWFSQDLTPDGSRQRPVKLLTRLEREVLTKAVHSSCTSRVMSEALATEYGCRPPTVIYNAFPWSDRKKIDEQFKDRRDRSVPSLHWYSQTLGQGRGLEDLIAALPDVKQEMEIHLRGNPVAGFNNWLNAHVPENWRKRIFLHRVVPNDELLSRIAEHDIGFAGEKKYSRSRDLTVTNKILHYLLGGLSVVASDTLGQKEIAEQAPSAVFLYPGGDPQELAEQLNLLLGSADRLRVAKAAALKAADEKFCWEKVALLLVRSVENALGNQAT